MSAPLYTPEDARQMLCPLSRTFGDSDLSAYCRVGDCAVWRWRPPMSEDPAFIAAIRRTAMTMAQEVAKAEGKEPSKAKHHMTYHKEAVRAVMEDPEGHGVSRKREMGWCGLGGKPEK